MTTTSRAGPDEGAAERAVLVDQRIAWSRPLPPPEEVRRELPIGPDEAEVVHGGRQRAADILHGRDQRLLVVVGPCSVHDPEAALAYARRLAALAAELRHALHVVMRVYFEKPRTTVGWKGLVNDPSLDGTFRVDEGLGIARRLLLDILRLGLPVGCEFLDPFVPQYLADAVSWGAIGARTAESQVHRQLASGLSMPVGIKNSTEGNVQVAVDAVAAASAPHVFTGITHQGTAAVFATTGNPDAHLVLRGGRHRPNHDPASVADASARLRASGLPPTVVVDASHGNSGKDHRRQEEVVDDLAVRLQVGEEAIVGVLLESFLVAGRQTLELGRADQLVFGQSVTDACMDWPTTDRLLRRLAASVGDGPARRSIATGRSPDHSV